MFVAALFLVLSHPSWQLVLQDGSQHVLVAEPQWLDPSRLLFTQNEQTFIVHKKLILRLESVPSQAPAPAQKTTHWADPAPPAIPLRTLPQPAKAVVVDDSTLERYRQSHVWVVPQCLAESAESTESSAQRDDGEKERTMERNEESKRAEALELKIAASRKRIGTLEDQIDLLKLKLRDSMEVEQRARLHEALVVAQKKWRREVDHLGAFVALSNQARQAATP
jgi:hypothetical protein